MCGRFTNEMTWAQLYALYKLSDKLFPVKSNMWPRYNIAPTQDVDFVHFDKAGNMELDRGLWWLAPLFAKELPKNAMFNACIESIDTSGAFREGFKSPLRHPNRQLFRMDDIEDRRKEGSVVASDARWRAV